VTDRLPSQVYKIWYQSLCALHTLLTHLNILFTENEKYKHVTEKAGDRSRKSFCILAAVVAKKIFFKINCIFKKLPANNLI